MLFRFETFDTGPPGDTALIDAGLEAFNQEAAPLPGGIVKYLMVRTLDRSSSPE